MAEGDDTGMLVLGHYVTGAELCPMFSHDGTS